MSQDNAPVWFITGCSTGFGREIARQVLGRGWRAVVTARNPEQVRDIVAGHEDNALALPLDVNDKDAVAHAVQAAEDKFGRIDVLVRLNSNKGTKHDMAISLIPFDRLDFRTFGYPQNVAPFSPPILGVEFRFCLASFSSEKSYSPSRLRCPARVSRNGWAVGQILSDGPIRMIQSDHRARKRMRWRRGGANRLINCRRDPPAKILAARISMSHLVPLLEFNLIAAHQGLLSDIEPFLKGLPGNLTANEEPGKVEKLGFVTSACPDLSEYDTAKTVLDQTKLAPFAGTGLSLVGTLEAGAALI